MQKKSITKKYILTFLVISSFFGLYNQTQAAEQCAVVEIKSVFNNTFTLNRKEELPVIQTGVKSENTCFSDNGQTKAVPDNYKDFTFEYNPLGFDSSSEIAIPDSMVSLNYGGTATISVQLPKTISRNTIFEGNFKEEYQLPDAVGSKKLFWLDTAEFDTISIKNGSITATSAEFDGSVTYENTAAENSGRIVPARSIVARVYKSDRTVFGEYPLSNSATLKYGQPLSLYAKITGLSPNTDYEIIFVDKNRRDDLDRSISKPFKTLAASSNNNNQNGGGATQAKFSAGDKVKVSAATLNVRNSASTTGALLGTQTSGTFGTVISGPTVQNGYTWWKIDYESGADGWSVENSLDKCVTSCSGEFTPQEEVGGNGAGAPSIYSGTPGTKGTTTVTLSDLTIESGTPSSVTVKGSVTYADSSKTGNPAVPDEKIAMKVYTVNAQNGLDFNKEITVPNINANYNQPATISTTINSLDPNKRYAVQFFEETYNNAKSSAKVIESINGNFNQSPNQPATNNPPSNQQQNPNPSQNPSSGGRGVLMPVVRSDLTTIPGIITALVEGVVIPIAVPLLAIAIIYTGFLFVQARGKPDKITKAKEALKWTLIGGAIILGSYIIAEALQSTISDIVRR